MKIHDCGEPCGHAVEEVALVRDEVPRELAHVHAALVLRVQRGHQRVHVLQVALDLGAVEQSVRACTPRRPGCIVIERCLTLTILSHKGVGLSIKETLQGRLFPNEATNL